MTPRTNKRRQPPTGRRRAKGDRGPALTAVVLAGGLGGRMRSRRNKLLHDLLGRPLVGYAVEVARDAGSNPVIAVLGHQREAVEAALLARFAPGTVTVVEQTGLRGTAEAARTAMPALARVKEGLLLILPGDVPLLRPETVAALVGTAERYACLAIVAATAPDPTTHARILRDQRGHVTAVVEDDQVSAPERAIAEVSPGIYCAPIAFFREALATLPSRNARERHLSDVVARAARTIGVSTIDAEWTDVAGIDDRWQLATAESALRARINRGLSAHVTFRDPGSTTVEPDVELGVDVELGRNVVLRGRTRIGHGSRVGEGCILTDVDVGAGAEIRPYTVASDAVIGARAVIGPFAHLRPGTRLAADVHVGNFVETKKAVIGRGSKANHLSYLGDAVVGERVNIGAGTITCNYDGYVKSQTVIEDQAFIGSDTQLVAPVRVGRRAIVGAGTTVTKDVAPGALALSRAPQIAKVGFAQKLAKRRAEGNANADANATKPDAAAGPSRIDTGGARPR